MRDTELTRHLWGLDWPVGRSSVEDGRVMCRLREQFPGGPGSSARTAMSSWRSMTTPRNGHGDPWTRVRC